MFTSCLVGSQCLPRLASVFARCGGAIEAGPLAEARSPTMFVATTHATYSRARQAIGVGAVHSRNHYQDIDIVRFQQHFATSKAVTSNYKRGFIDGEMSGPSDAAHAIKSCRKSRRHTRAALKEPNMKNKFPSSPHLEIANSSTAPRLS